MGGFEAKCSAGRVLSCRMLNKLGLPNILCCQKRVLLGCELTHLRTPSTNAAKINHFANAASYGTGPPILCRGRRGQSILVIGLEITPHNGDYVALMVMGRGWRGRWAAYFRTCRSGGPTLAFGRW